MFVVASFEEIIAATLVRHSERSAKDKNQPLNALAQRFHCSTPLSRLRRLRFPSEKPSVRFSPLFMLDRLRDTARRSLDRFSTVAVERASLLRILSIFFVLIFAFGASFWLLARYGDAVRASGVQTKLSIGDALYFSVVTISSLGYGDLAPAGIGKLLACLEVLLGLALMGILIAKLSSARLSFIVRRLYATDAQSRLTRFVTDFDRLGSNADQILGKSARAFAEIPNLTDEQRRAQDGLASETAAEFESFLAGFRNVLLGMHDYLRSEVEHGAFFEDAPLDPFVRVGERLGQIAFLLAQLIISLPATKRVLVFSVSVRQRLNDALQSANESCELVLQHCTREDVRAVYATLQNTARQVPQELFNVPGPIVQAPDQILPAAVEPQ